MFARTEGAWAGSSRRIGIDASSCSQLSDLSPDLSATAAAGVGTVGSGSPVPMLIGRIENSSDSIVVNTNG